MAEIQATAREHIELAITLITDLGQLTKDLATLEAQYDRLGR